MARGHHPGGRGPAARTTRGSRRAPSSMPSPPRDTSSASPGTHRSTCDAQLAAVIAHELGHHIGGRSWAGLLGQWYSLPGRTLRWAAVRLGLLLGRSQSSTTVVVLTVAACWFTWATLAATCGPSLLLLDLPWVMAAVGRRAELRADAHAASFGFVPLLAGLLEQGRRGGDPPPPGGPDLRRPRGRTPPVPPPRPPHPAAPPPAVPAAPGERRRAATLSGDRPAVTARARLSRCTGRSRSPPAGQPGRSRCRRASSRCRRSRRPSTSRPWPPRWARPGCCGSGRGPYRPG